MRGAERQRGEPKACFGRPDLIEGLGDFAIRFFYKFSVFRMVIAFFLAFMLDVKFDPKFPVSADTKNIFMS